LRPGDPETIGPWTLQGRIGSGGMGVVYLATNDKGRVALKVVRSHFMDDPSLRERFSREVETLHRVRSPFVAEVIDADTTSELAWVATEYVDGPNLKVKVEGSGPLDPDEWVRLAGGLLRALQATHDLGIVHRDVKPANILLADDAPKLIDFGIAQAGDATSLTTTGLIAGSPAWLCPEQINDTNVGTAGDLFSAGSVLAYAATGRQPWGPPGLPPAVVLARITTEDPDIDGVSDVQGQIIRGLLCKDPGERLTAAQALSLLPKPEPDPQPEPDPRPTVEPQPDQQIPTARPRPISTAPTPVASAAHSPVQPAPSLAADSATASSQRRKVLLWTAPVFAVAALIAGLQLVSGGSDQQAVAPPESEETQRSAEVEPTIEPTEVAQATSPSEDPEPVLSYRTRVEYANKDIPEGEFDVLAWTFDVCATDQDLLEDSVIEQVILSKRDGDSWNRLPNEASASPGGRCEDDEVNLIVKGEEEAPSEDAVNEGFGACQRYRVAIPETKDFAASTVNFCVRSAADAS